MAKLKTSDIEHVAKLAKLDLTDSEVDKFTSQLSEVVEHISELSKVDTKGVEPTSQTTGLTNVYREDLVKPDNAISQEDAIGGSDKTYNGYFKVDAILSERSDK